MSCRSALVLFSVFLLACAEAGQQADDDTAGPDASVVVTPDAPDNTPRPDAAAIPDAAPGTPDAAPPPDAPAVPDAAPGTPDAAPAPDAMATPDAGGCTDQVIQLLGNAGFDSGPGGGWVEQSMYALINAMADLPAAVGTQAGTHAAWMGGDNDLTDLLYQDVAVPAGATDLELIGYRWSETEESGGVYDTVTVQLASTGSTVLETLATWSNSDAVSAWTPFTLPASGSYGGQTVRVYIEANTDSIYRTSFFFDSFALRVTVCQ